MSGISARKGGDEGGPPVAQNRQAHYAYYIEETLEVGIVLTGTEVKSLRLGRTSLNEAYAGPKDDGIYLFNMHISPYPHAHRTLQHEPKRPRKLLMHRRESNRLSGAVRRDGVTLVPLRLYFNRRGLLKLALGLGKGKKTVDKRETVKERDWKRRQGRLMREMS